MKRKLIIVLPAILLLLAAGGLLFHYFGPGSAPVERWIGSQLGTVAGQYLNPRLSLGAVRYHYPLTAVVDNVRLVADDPAKRGAKIDIFAARQVTLEMAEIPQPGRPLRIQKLILDHPEFRAVSVSKDDASLVGFSNLLKGTHPETHAGVQGRPEVKLSDVFNIRFVEVVDGLIVYDPRTAGAKPMDIDQVSFRLTVEPTKDAETGWYAVEMNLERKPVFATRLAGRINLDTMVIAAQPLRMEVALGREQDHYFPPQTQAMLREHDVSGHLAVEISGSLSTTDWRASNLTANLTLADGNLAMGENRIALQRLDLQWILANRQGTLERLQATILGGQVEAHGRVALNGPLDARCDVHLGNLRLEQCMRNAAGGNGQYRGNLSGDISWNGPLAKAGTQSHGSGTIRVVDGDLEHIPVLEHILAEISKTMKKVGVGSGRTGDTADAAFTIEGNRVNLSNVLIVTRLVALHGHGSIYFNTNLDLLINAGPVEKLESLLGSIGSLLGKVTDEISAYALTGTLGQPKVRVVVAPHF